MLILSLNSSARVKFLFFFASVLLFNNSAISTGTSSDDSRMLKLNNSRT